MNDNKTHDALDSTSLKNIALKALPLIDLTSLNETDTDAVITKLCQDAHTPYGQVAAVCVYPKFVEHAKLWLKQEGSNVKVATVTNFPNGGNDPHLAMKETELARQYGADEIDIVFPYQAFMAGDRKIAQDLVQSCREACGDNLVLKVILESGVMQSESDIRSASEICIEQGADFLKTSTGKVAVNATLEATGYMLDTIKQSGKVVGFKAAGGIKTTEQAMDYLALAESIMGTDYLKANRFRFGASSLLNHLLASIEGRAHSSTNSGY